jgi:hypothetical protein
MKTFYLKISHLPVSYLVTVPGTLFATIKTHVVFRWKTALDVPNYSSYVYPIYACASVFNRMSFFQSFVRNVKVSKKK